MPTMVYEIFELLGAAVRLIGLLVFGLGAGWLVLEAFRKDIWQLQIAAVLGFFGLAVGLTCFTPAGGLGAYTLGAGAALLLWGMQKKRRKDEAED